MLPVICETIRELHPQKRNLFPEPGPRQLAAPPPYPQPTMGCLPVSIGIFTIVSGGTWWLGNPFVKAGDADLVAGSHRVCQEPHHP